MNTNPVLEHLRDHVCKLKALLDTPQPDYAPWVKLYCKHMEVISNYRQFPPLVLLPRENDKGNLNSELCKNSISRSQ